MILSKISNKLSPVRAPMGKESYAKIAHYLLILGLFCSVGLGIVCATSIDNSGFKNVFLVYICLSSLVLMICAYILMSIFNSNQVVSDNLTLEKAELSKMIENLKKEKEDLQKENEMRDHLIRVVSHDAKGPIRNLEGILDLALEGDMKSEVPTEMLVKLRGATKYTNYILDNLLLWTETRMNEDTQVLDKVSLKSLIDQIVQESNFIAQSKKIKLENKVDEGIVVLADYQTLWIVVNNLVANGIKFTKENQQVTISAEVSNSEVRVDVEDSGIGIPLVILERIFMPDLKKVRSGTKNEKGSGIGLVLCKKLIESQNGRISVMSEVGKGSVFSIELARG